MNVLHLIDTVEKVNFGIWNAALINSSYLKTENVVSYALFPRAEFCYDDVTSIPFDDPKDIPSLLKNFNLSTSDTLVISHGCWRWPTKVGNQLHRKGFKWIAVPHGMLEPWSIAQKRLKKKIYWNLIEKRLLREADYIRAVGKPEYDNLIQVFREKTRLIHNGVELIQPTEIKSNESLKFLFMARLHHKKGVIPLVKGWKSSGLNNNSRFELNIAGPDDGERDKLLDEIEGSTNINYLGAIYGKEKNIILNQHDVYVLPSYSEGFPSSVVEAMTAGLVPLISEGCNFPEAFNNSVAYQIEPTQVKSCLERIANMDIAQLKETATKAQDFAINDFSNKVISNKLLDLYKSLIS